MERRLDLEIGMNAVTQWVQDYGTYAVVTLLLLAVVVWAYRPGSKRRYEEDTRLPFDEDEKKHRRV
jgi:cbb3-type cytochrome oxidase subunit 3